MNNKITLNLTNNNYDILIGSNELNSLEQFLSKKKYSRIFVISDNIVSNLYLSKLENALNHHKFETILVKNGEQSKSFEVLQQVCEEILAKNIDRNSLIIAFGGGVIGDLSGFVASILLRGIDFIQIPTTLLAMVDSSVGGKTAINSQNGKNLIGSFYQPKLVICDINFLASLNDREFLAGYAEVLKYGLIYDKDFFYFLDENLAKIFQRQNDILTKIITKSCEIKAEIVAKDEKEQDIRALLNFGHSFAHIFETETEYSDKLLHGEAVGIGMLMASKMSKNLGLINEEIYQIIKNHIEKAGLNFDLKKIKNSWNLDDLIKHLKKDKKNTNQNLTFILLKNIGEAIIDKSATIDDFSRIINEFKLV